MTTFPLSLRTIAMALTMGAAAYGLTAHAQTHSGTNEGASTSSGSGVVQKVEKTTRKVGNATERTAKKIGKATDRAALRASGAVRHTGEKIARKLPKGNAKPPVDEQGRPGNEAR